MKQKLGLFGEGSWETDLEDFIDYSMQFWTEIRKTRNRRKISCETEFQELRFGKDGLGLLDESGI